MKEDKKENDEKKHHSTVPLRVWNYRDLDIHIILSLTAVGMNILTIKPWLKPIVRPYVFFADVQVNRFFANELSSWSQMRCEV